ncbi:MAG: hypothetical protein K0Q70_1995 [Rhodospirillales bacterium]|nr:hypothetical protein [Rhodospirillales bacterium]
MAFRAAVSTAFYLDKLYTIHGADYFEQAWQSNGMRVFILMFLYWLFGIGIIGGSVWCFLHRKGRHRFWVAVAAGGLASFVASMALSTRLFTGLSGGSFSYYGRGGTQWSHGVMTAFGWKLAFLDALEAGLYGLIIGAVIWRIAYRKRQDNPIAAAGLSSDPG